jgi:hypothetical protein
MRCHPLVQRAEKAGMTLWLEGGKMRWKATQPPPPELLDALRKGRAEVEGALRLSPGAATLLASAEAAYSALTERENDGEEEAERAAIFGRPAPGPRGDPPALFETLSPMHEEAPAAAVNRSFLPGSTMEERTLAMLITPGVEVVVERDGWLRISLPDGSYAFAQRATAERAGWREQTRQHLST